MNTPWGKSERKTVIAEGIEFHSTMSHGGMLVSHDLLRKMPMHLRSGDFYIEDERGGWFEEDCEITKVILSFPHLFTERQVQGAKAIFNQFYS